MPHKLDKTAYFGRKTIFTKEIDLRECKGDVSFKEIEFSIEKYSAMVSM